jgi:predicted anti-sigma-YlaC factor YlaD
MKDCRRIRKAVSQALPLSAELEEHLFACPGCRRFVRVEQILGLMHEFRQAPGSSSPEFVDRVMNGREERVEEQPKKLRLEVMRWAAVLVFSVAAGYGFSVWESGTKSLEWVASLSVSSNPIASIETLGLPYPLLPL